MTRHTVIHALMLLMLLPLPLLAAVSPDELYAKGRYEEARQGYEKLDMDNPSDLRFRYNRGCAAFQEGKFDEAKAAFSSVVRRSQDEDMRFRGLYNLGNTSFRQGDFSSARDYYRGALKVRPDDPDAGHNLELALKSLKKQQSEKENQKGGDQQKKDNQKGSQGQQGDKSGSGKDQETRQEQGQQDKHQGGNKGEQGKQPGQQPPTNRNNHAGQQKGQGENRQDLSGELKARNPAQGSGTEAGRRQDTAAGDMERQRASALLDNVKEDRSHFNAIHGIQGGSMSTGSGKEW
jgi:Ca-activated chloride channel homolog